MLIDTHCHINESDYPIDADVVIDRAHKAGVAKMICVGTDQTTSREALEFASLYDNVYYSVGVHPHYASGGLGEIQQLLDPVSNIGNKLVAIGEIGLDYHYSHSSHDDQVVILKKQIELALKYNLPIIFHVREAYDDFWPIIDNYQGIRGVLHCFTDTQVNADEGIKRGFYFGVNGISTFTSNDSQKAMFANLPMDKVLLETDAPMLTPYPLRGKIKVNEPAFVREIAENIAAVHQVSLDEVSRITTANACALFNL